MRSIVSYKERGEGGRANYRGNCSPRLITDLISQYHLESLNDFMCGSGTTKDACNAAGIHSACYDLNTGYDMLTMDIPERSENIFWHPPYHNIIVYSDKMYSAKAIQEKYGFDPKKSDLSRINSYEDFMKAYNYCLMKQFYSLSKNGRLFMLVGDIKKKGKLFSPILDCIKVGTIEQLIIKEQINCWSDNKVYANNNFVPIVHEYLLVIKKENALIFDVTSTRKETVDIRNRQRATWKDVVFSLLEEYGSLKLEEIYKKLEGSKKARENSHYKEKIRQTLYQGPFEKADNYWKVAKAA